MSTAVKQRVRLQCFGILEEVCGGAEHDIEIAALPARVDAVLEAFAARIPALREHLPRTACAVGDSIVGRDHLLSGDQPLVLIPPVSGG